MAKSRRAHRKTHRKSTRKAHRKSTRKATRKNYRTRRNNNMFMLGGFQGDAVATATASYKSPFVTNMIKY